jgi:hypothetical protein
MGRITTRQVAPKAKVATARVVERVRIPRKVTHTRKETSARAGDGIQIGDSWVVIRQIGLNRIRLTIEALEGTPISPSQQVVLD